MNLKVGDRVRIVNLVGWYYQDEANFFEGKEGTIVGIDIPYYKLDVPADAWTPTTLWLENELELIK